MKDCRKIIMEHLENNGYDGLFMPGECGCVLDDLIPCENDFSICCPGYKHINVEWDGEIVDWLIGPKKQEFKTSEEWQTICKVKVIDPDGWDRRNYQFSWHEEKIQKEEFEKRLSNSTCMWPSPMINKDTGKVVDIWDLST